MTMGVCATPVSHGRNGKLLNRIRAQGTFKLDSSVPSTGKTKEDESRHPSLRETRYSPSPPPVETALAV
jgi:hypothetical protein